MTAKFPQVEFDTKATKGLTTADSSDVLNFVSFVSRKRYTLDQLEALINAAFPVGFFVYRGGNHVALHAVHGDSRILMLSVDERKDAGLPLAVVYK